MPAKTITAFRLVSPRWASTALSGEGARKFGGRWNSPGHPAVYLAESRALGALELLVHLTTPDTRSKPFVLIQVTLPDKDVDTIEATSLPADWNISPPTRASMSIGDDWLARNQSLALRVPSVIVPEETNLLLNISHPKMREVTITAERRFRFDARL